MSETQGNVIQIKRGWGTPPSDALGLGELGIDMTTKKIYIGHANSREGQPSAIVISDIGLLYKVAQTADEAASGAANAVATANSAVATANSAVATADHAFDEAGNAYQMASAAKTDAANAKTDAANAKTDAANAKTDAANAKTNAANAADSARNAWEDIRDFERIMLQYIDELHSALQSNGIQPPKPPQF